MKYCMWLLVIEGSNAFNYLINKQKYLEKGSCRFVSQLLTLNSFLFVFFKKMFSDFEQ